MLVEKLFNSNLSGLEKVMDLSWRRHQAIASNIANAETPQYQAVDLHFGSEIKKAFGEQVDNVKQSDSRHLDIEENTTARLIPDYSGMVKPDGNNVDIDLQMGRLAQNSSKYTQAATLIRKQFETMRTIIRSA
jgi:flagellar basal-body rod protein FlgB